MADFWRTRQPRRLALVQAFGFGVASLAGLIAAIAGSGLETLGAVTGTAFGFACGLNVADALIPRDPPVPD